MIVVQVRFFGGSHLFTHRLSPAIERALPAVELQDDATIDDLLAALNISRREGRPLVSVNHFYRRDNASLSDGDQVQLLKTVVGG
jgi:sulfur carrier protein ThiS